VVALAAFACHSVKVELVDPPAPSLPCRWGFAAMTRLVSQSQFPTADAPSDAVQHPLGATNGAAFGSNPKCLALPATLLQLPALP
jgi:hypothetical protein